MEGKVPLCIYTVSANLRGLHYLVCECLLGFKIRTGKTKNATNITLKNFELHGRRQFVELVRSCIDSRNYIWSEVEAELLQNKTFELIECWVVYRTLGPRESEVGFGS